MAERYDAIVIGTGQSGPSLAVRLANAGRKTAIIERKLFGGTCVNVGCIPTKTLIASARAAHVARHGADFGVAIDGGITVDMMRVKARKDSVVRQSNEGVTKWLKGTPNLTVLEGHARLEGPRTVRVNGRELEAAQIFLNVGGRASVPDMPGIAEVGYLTNSSMMDVDFLPEHLVIIGGSYIGLEFAQMYRRFGSRVTVVEMGPRLIGREDEDVSQGVQDIFSAEGVDLRLYTIIYEAVADVRAAMAASPWRDYASGFAAFAQTDPVREQDSPYQAFSANPVNFTDPTGAFTFADIKITTLIQGILRGMVYGFVGGFLSNLEVPVPVPPLFCQKSENS